MTKYLHTMIRVNSLEDSIAFFKVLGLRENRTAVRTPPNRAAATLTAAVWANRALGRCWMTPGARLRMATSKRA